jgi:hypothetical protein
MTIHVQQIEQCVNWVVGKPLAWALYLVGQAARWGLIALVRTAARWDRREGTPTSRN